MEGRSNRGNLPWDWRRTVLFTAFGAGYQGGAQYLIFNRGLVRCKSRVSELSRTAFRGTQSTLTGLVVFLAIIIFQIHGIT